MLFIRSLFGNIWIYGCIALGVVLCSIFGWFVPQTWVIAFWNRFMLPCALWGLKVFGGIAIEVRGMEHIDQFKGVYAVKHESALDTYCLTPIINRATMILKKELMYIPIFGWVAWMYGLISVDRSAGAAAMKKMLAGARKKVKDNRPIIIFPEGHRVRAGTVLKYKPGFLFMAQNLNLPVIPVALNTGMFWPRHSFTHLPGKAIIEFMEPMVPGKNKEEFMAVLEEKIESKCKELNAQALRDYPYTRKNLELEK